MPEPLTFALAVIVKPSNIPIIDFNKYQKK